MGRKTGNLDYADGLSLATANIIKTSRDELIRSVLAHKRSSHFQYRGQPGSMYSPIPDICKHEIIEAAWDD